MTKLELIEEKIKDYERFIADREQHYIPYLKKRDLYEAVVMSQEQIKIFREKVKLLQQIKAELEAWEVVKKHCDYQDGNTYNCIPRGFYLIAPIKGKDYLTIKKALEVENDT